MAFPQGFALGLMVIPGAGLPIPPGGGVNNLIFKDGGNVLLKSSPSDVLLLKG